VRQESSVCGTMPGLCGETQRTAHRGQRADGRLPGYENEETLDLYTQHGVARRCGSVDDSCSVFGRLGQKLTTEDS
jgi:hypothetical protein